MTHFLTFAEMQRALREEVERRGMDLQTARALRRAAREPDTSKVSPSRTRAGGMELVARSLATNEVQILRDAAGRPYRYTYSTHGDDAAAQALAARDALREAVRRQQTPTARQDGRPSRQIPDPRDADHYHMTDEIKREARAAGVELYGPDGTQDRLELRDPSERAIDLANLARLDDTETFQLKALPAARGGFNLALIDVRDGVPDVLTNTAGQALTYGSKDDAMQDAERLFDLSREQAQEQERDNDRGGRSR